MAHRIRVFARSSFIVLLACAAGAIAARRGAAAIRCVGDCSGDGEVTVDELIQGVNIALGTAGIGGCPSFDSSGDGEVTVDELLQGVNAALNGCAALPPSPSPSLTATPTESAIPTDTATATVTPTETATPTETGTPTETATPTITPTATDTPAPVARSVAARVAVVADGLSVIPSVVTALVTGVTAGGGEVSCPAGGMVALNCSPSVGITVSLTFTACAVDTAEGVASFTGTITLRGNGVCPFVFPPLDATVNLTAALMDGTGETKLNVAANISASVPSGVPDLTRKCYATGADLVLNGDVSAQVPGDGGARVEFTNTLANLAISQSNDQCAPLKFALTFNGPATVIETASEESFAVIFSNFVFAQDATVTPAQVRLDGGLSSSCFGGVVSMMTETPMTSPLGSACFNSGAIRVAAGPGEQRIVYLDGGRVDIDNNADGLADESYPSCLAPELLMCPQ